MPEVAVAPQLSVVVPTYRRHDRLPRLVAALERQTLDPALWELVVVDDCTPGIQLSDVEALVRSDRIAVRCVRTSSNGGPAVARNVGWRSSSGTYIAFTDDDCEPAPGWLSAGLARLEADPAVGVLQGRTLRLLPPGGSYEYTPLTVIREVARPSPWFEGCNLFLRRDSLEGAGGFDESIGWFGEETALAYRVMELGWRRGWSFEALVRHDLEERPFRWHVRNHFLEGNIVRVAARNPAFRSALWRSWSPSRESGVFSLAVAGSLGALVWRPAALLALPYCTHVGRLLRDGGGKPLPVAFDVARRAASFTGKVLMSARQRVFIV